LALGDTIVRQCGLRTNEDVVGQWMAHHLAEKLKKVRAARGAEKAPLEADLFNTILKFWKHRAHFPRGHAPFEKFDAVFRALESLDPDQERGRFYRFDFPQPAKTELGSETQEWISTARNLDELARSLVTFCIANAAHAAGGLDETWLNAAKILPAEDQIEIKVVFVTKETIEKFASPTLDVNKIQRDQLVKLQSRLKRFSDSAALISRTIDERLKLVASSESSVKKPSERARAPKKWPTSRSDRD
jgi:hypothetical protein